jgi:hypothetical protein
VVGVRRPDEVGNRLHACVAVRAPRTGGSQARANRVGAALPHFIQVGGEELQAPSHGSVVLGGEGSRAHGCDRRNRHPLDPTVRLAAVDVAGRA